MSDKNAKLEIGALKYKKKLENAGLKSVRKTKVKDGNRNTVLSFSVR